MQSVRQYDSTLDGGLEVGRHAVAASFELRARCVSFFILIFFLSFFILSVVVVVVPSLRDRSQKEDFQLSKLEAGSRGIQLKLLLSALCPMPSALPCISLISVHTVLSLKAIHLAIISDMRGTRITRKCEQIRLQ